MKLNTGRDPSEGTNGSNRDLWELTCEGALEIQTSG